MTTAGPTLAAAFAMVSLPKHPQHGFGLSPAVEKPDTSFPMSGEGPEPCATENNGTTPTIQTHKHNNQKGETTASTLYEAMS